MPQLKVKWDNVAEDSASAWMHTNVLMSDATLMESSLDQSEENRRGADLLRAIFKVYGVQDAWVDRYKIRVVRTTAVEWTSICIGVLEAVEAYCQEKKLSPPEISPSGSVARA